MMIAPRHIARRLLVLAIFSASSLAHGDNLLDIYNQAAQGDPQILAAAAAHRAAQEARPQSLAQLLPQVVCHCQRGRQPARSHRLHC